MRRESTTFPLKTGMNILGRQRDVDIQIKDPYISRRHLSIDVLSDGSMTLMDLGSCNGLIVDGVKVPSAVLKTGQSFTLGLCTLFIEEDRAE
ncbi:FHA domain-containing protein [Fibrobacterota bacterium]